MLENPFVHLYTRDIEAGLRFYRELLGFKETFRTPTKGTPKHVELTLRGFGLGLGTVEAAKRVHGVDASPGTPAMALVIWIDDVDKAYEQLTSAGTPIVQPPHNVGKHNRNALLRDPRWKPRRDRGQGGLTAQTWPGFRPETLFCVFLDFLNR